MQGADVVVDRLRSWGTGKDKQLTQLHDLVAGKLSGTRYMAEFDAECQKPEGPSGWARDRVQHAVASAIAHDPEFATQVRGLL
ncbi:hypothetical protein GCM10022223_66090 [Kineosporia mesophila]|uniref:Uncharacterized protein n=1 Tax=Kineosporia mesophila TaxID=566012 RepID=A0ABP7ARF7_9ACTN|nr:hypothetical protein [Kineosporia mesophila]MCD5349143.1 hypothetical protein [Kineosporia mesophila]